MTTLGNATQPSGQVGTAANAIYLQRVQASVAGVLESIEAWTVSANASYAEQIYLLVSDNAGAPGTLLAQSAAFFGLPDGTMGLKSALLPTLPAVSASAWYWVGTQVEHDSIYVANEADGASDGWSYFGAAGFGTIPADFAGLGALVDNVRYGFSGTYVESGPTVTQISNPIVIGGTGYSGKNTGFGYATTITNGQITATGDDGAEHTFNFNMDDFQEGYSHIGHGDVELEISDGVDSAFIEVTLDIMAGYSAAGISSLSADADSLYTIFFTIYEIQIGSTFYYEADEITIYGDTTVSDINPSTEQIELWVREPSGLMIKLILEISDIIEGGVAYSSKLTAISCTAITLTAITIP